MTAGIEDGRRTKRSAANRPPPQARTMVSEPPSAERSPSMVPTSVVKNTASAARITLARSGSKLSCSSGITATSGSTWMVSARRRNRFSAARNCTNRIPATMAARLPNSQPRTATHAVVAKLRRYSSGRSKNSATISVGGASTPRRARPMRAAASHTTSSARLIRAVAAQRGNGPRRSVGRGERRAEPAMPVAAGSVAAGSAPSRGVLELTPRSPRNRSRRRAASR